MSSTVNLVVAAVFLASACIFLAHATKRAVRKIIGERNYMLISLAKRKIIGKPPLSPAIKAFKNRNPDVPDLPNLIYVEMAMACNFGCKMCPVPESQKLMDGRRPSIMKPDTFALILDAIRDKPRYVWLTQMGELMLNKHLANYVKIAKADGHRVGFTTNGSLMTDAKAKELLDAGIDYVVFSFDGATKDTFERIRIGGNYDEVVANIRRFAAINSETRPEGKRCTVQVDMLISDLTEHEVDAFHSMWKDIAIPQAHLIDNWAGQLDLPAEFGERRVPRQDGNRYPCNLMWKTAYVSASGQAILCCHDYKLRSKLPRVHDKPLDLIWREDVRIERARHVAGDFTSPACANCQAWRGLQSPEQTLQ